MSPHPHRTTRVLRRMLAAAVALLVPFVATIAPAAEPGDPEEDDRIKVLVFAQPFDFVHASIEAGSQYLDSLEGDEFVVDVSTDIGDLRLATLQRYDVLVWNNVTGRAPLSQAERDDLVGWVRDGNGFVAVHAAADSGFDWPEFHEMVGGIYDGHWYRFGGLTPEPYRLAFTIEDPDNPLMAGVPADYDSYDETYKWQVDPRPDVHVLMSMVNESIGPQGAIYHYAHPMTWCRPFGDGRTWYTNLGHDPALWDDPVYTGMVTNALRYAGDRLEGVDCAVPVDPATGVAGAERMQPVWAQVDGPGRSAPSTYSGGMTVLTGIRAGQTTVTYRDVDLTGVQAVDVFAVAQTIGDAQKRAPGVGIGLAPARVTPASGGTVEIRLGSSDGPVIGSVDIPSWAGSPSPLSSTNVPAPAGPAREPVGTTGSWNLLTTPLTPTDGRHDIVLTFTPSAVGTAASTAPGGEDVSLVGSLGWIRLAR